MFARIRLAIALAACLYVATGVGQSLERALELQGAIGAEAVASQRAVDSAYDETRRILAERDALLDESDALSAYTEHLAMIVAAHERGLDALNERLGAMETAAAALPERIEGLIDGLDVFVESDLPFHRDDRLERIERLRDGLADPQLSVASQYQRVVDAYLAEIDYGREVEAYREGIEVGGETLDVELLRIGRIALLYRSADGSRTGYWDRGSSEWLDLPRHYRRSLERGLALARGRGTPELLEIPVPAPR